MRNLIPSLIQQYYQQGESNGEFDALTMFVDVSGFTAMTQALMRAGHEGAEILATILNQVFELMVNAVYAHGGFISAFAGDAFTAVFPLKREDVSAEEFALQMLVCAERIQTIFRRHGLQSTPYGQFTLQVKVGLSGGKVEWGIVGHTNHAYFFRGAAIDGCVAAEHHADKGGIIFDASVGRLFPLDYLETESLSEGYLRLCKLPHLLPLQLPRLKLQRRPRVQRALVARFLPDAVINFKEFGEFRPVVPVFISFAGLDTVAQLDVWVTGLFRQIAVFGGYFHHLDFGDKGGIAICGFGAPVAYENMVDRALNFIDVVQKDLADTKILSDLKIRAGITYGMVYAGIAGGTKRCEYTCYGEVVNLAARLMMHAAWGEVLVSTSVCQRTGQFTFEHLGDLQYKGIATPIPTFRMLRRKAGQRRQTFTTDMIGRQTELQQLQAFAAPIFTGYFAGLASIFGEAGIGKSRLAYALKENLSLHNDLYWFHCPVDQILRKSFNPFIPLLLSYFEQSPEQTPEENKSHFEVKYQTLVEALSPHPDPLPQGRGRKLLSPHKRCPERVERRKVRSEVS